MTAPTSLVPVTRSHGSPRRPRCSSGRGLGTALVAIVLALATWPSAATPGGMRADPPATCPSPRPAPPRSATMSIDSTLGEIFDTPAALAALARYAPGLTANPASSTNLRKFTLSFVARHMPTLRPREVALLDAELKRIPAPPPDLSGPLGDPSWRPQTLTLADRPKSSGRTVVLFDGRSLDGWDVFLGPRERQPGSNAPVGSAIGLNDDQTPIFSVQAVDGAPAIRADGRIWGTLTTKGDFADYHLHLEYKWGERRWPQAAPIPRNNGVLYHSHGRFGAIDRTWMEGVELEMIPCGQVGGVNPVGADTWFRTRVGRDPAIDTRSRRRFVPNGREIAVGPQGFDFVQGNSDPERPVGEWNSIDLYVVGDRAIHVVNGVPVVAIDTITGRDRAALTHGRIQLQSEGSETFFRNITLRPIARLPGIRAGR